MARAGGSRAHAGRRPLLCGAAVAAAALARSAPPPGWAPAAPPCLRAVGGGGGCPRGGRRRIGAAARAAAGAGSEAVASLQDQWRNEAERCWTADDTGVVPGWIGDFTPPDREYNPWVLMYSSVEPGNKPKSTDPRPWRRLEGAPEPKPVVEGSPTMLDFKRLMDFLGDEAGGVLLDLGCGEGVMSRRVLGTGKFERVFALDVSWMQLEIARTAAEEERLGPDQGLLLMRGDVQELPFREGLADAAWWGMGAHKVQDPAEAYGSIAASLRPGGKLLATSIISGADGKRPEDLEAKARAAGFAEVEVETLVQGPERLVYLRAIK